MVHPNIFKPRNDWNVISLRCKKDAFHIRVALIISDIWGVNPMKDKSYQGYENVISRQLFAVMMRRYTKETLKNIGAYIGKDHATVLGAKRSIQNLIDTDKTFRAKYKSIDQFCKSLSDPGCIMMNEKKFKV